MTIREQLQNLGKELLTLAGLQSDIEERICGTKKKLDNLILEVDDALDERDNEHY